MLGQLRAMLRRRREVSAKGWHILRFLEWRQDTQGVFLLDGTWDPPTYDWTAIVTALRSDHVSFAWHVVLKKEEVTDGKVDLKVVGARLANLMLTMESYRNCECEAAHRCAIHRTWMPRAIDARLTRACEKEGSPKGGQNGQE